MMEGRLQKSRDSLMRHGMAMAIAGSTALGVEVGERTPAGAPRAATEMRASVLPLEHATFTPEADWFVPHPGGAYTAAEQKERSEVLERGERIRHDVELDFYLVQPGDTIQGIIKKLSQYPQYAYLREQTQRLQSFNISPDELRAHMWIPIPLENADRHITDEQFVLWAREGVSALLKHHTYGRRAALLLSLPGMNGDKLVASALAVARQESGGNPLGTNEFHRWEGAGRHREFSFSLFHILMTPEGPGMRARRALMMTEGQTYHPTNAMMLFLAFLIEKLDERKDLSMDSLLPFDDPHKVEKFAGFNNGTEWRKMNPRYAANILQFYARALEVVKTILHGAHHAPQDVLEVPAGDSAPGLSLEVVPESLLRRPGKESKNELRTVNPMMVSVAPGETMREVVARANVASGNVLRGSGVYVDRITGEILSYLGRRFRQIDYRTGNQLGLAKLSDGSIAVILKHREAEVRWVTSFASPR